MRKSLITLAVLAAASGAASAQSNVTIFGIVDVSVTHGTGSLASKTQLASGELSGSRLGFRGTEDLGGGLKANFWLEMGMNPANGSGVTTTTNNQASGLVGGGALTFNRISFVSLSGNWGELRMGRDYTPTFNSHVYYDPAALSGVMTSQTAIGSLTIFAPNAPGVALAGARASNSVSYFSPNMSGFNAQVMYAMGNNPSNVPTPDDGKYTGARLQYAAGPLDLSVAAARMKLAAVGDVRETVIAGTYDFNPLKVWGIYLRDTSGTSINVKAEMLGVTYPVGVTLLKATFSRSSATSVTGAPAGTTNKFALGAVYNLSKRTSIYLSGATVRNKDGASAMPFFGVAVNGPNGTSRAFDLGVRHIF